MHEDNVEYQRFNAAMDSLLKADPKVVKEIMEQEKRERAKEQKSKGKLTPGRKKAEVVAKK